jgi:hypothetical protein
MIEYDWYGNGDVKLMIQPTKLGFKSIQRAIYGYNWM